MVAPVVPVEVLVKVTLSGAQPELGLAVKLATCAPLIIGIKKEIKKKDKAKKCKDFFIILDSLPICPKIDKKTFNSNLTMVMLKMPIVIIVLERNTRLFLLMLLLQ